MCIAYIYIIIYIYIYQPRSSAYGKQTHFSRQPNGRLKQPSSAEAERLQLHRAGPQRPENKHLGKEGVGGMRRQIVSGAKGPAIGGKKTQCVGGVMMHENRKLDAKRGTDHSESKSAHKVAELAW